MLCSPGLACHVYRHCRHVSSLGTPASSASSHSPPSMRTSPAADPAVHRPGDATDLVRPGLDVTVATRTVDPRHRLDRALPLAQPLGTQYRVERVPHGGLDLGDPLGGRHVAVQARHDHPHRVAVLGTQRLALPGRWPASRHGRPVVRGDRRSARPSVDRAADELFGPSAWTPASPQHVGQHHTLPDAVADEIAADLVRHTRQRHVALDLLPGRGGRRTSTPFRDRPCHRSFRLHGRLRDLGNNDRGVDAVELVGRGDEGADPIDPEVELASRRARRTGGRK